jgi:hypothetical protein
MTVVTSGTGAEALPPVLIEPAAGVDAVQGQVSLAKPSSRLRTLGFG